MNRPDMQTYSKLYYRLRSSGKKRVKAAYKYEVVEETNRQCVAGKKFHFIGAEGIRVSGGKGGAVRSRRLPCEKRLFSTQSLQVRISLLYHPFLLRITGIVCNRIYRFKSRDLF